MKKKILKKVALPLIFLEFILIIFLLSFFPKIILAGVGENNVTVQTLLDVGAVYPEVINVSIEEDAASVSLNPATTKKIYCAGVVVDYNGQQEIDSVMAEFYDSVVSGYGSGDDNNEHYANSSCEIINDTAGWNGYADDAYNAVVNCSMDVWYYANPQTWECTIFAIDTTGLSDTGTDTITVSDLLALGLPDTINYGTVNATYVSEENITNVTNYGNVELNLSLNGYGFIENDGYAMNCTLGAIKTIPIDYEKYNLTASTLGELSLTSFENVYLNLTSAPVTKRFDLNYRQNDILNEAWNHTYWRIYVPLGVAGTCQGNIIFGAVQADGS